MCIQWLSVLEVSRRVCVKGNWHPLDGGKLRRNGRRVDMKSATRRWRPACECASSATCSRRGRSTPASRRADSNVFVFSPCTPNVVTCVCTVTAIGSRIESRGKPEVVAAVLSMSFRKPRYLVFIAQSVHLVYPLSRLFKSWPLSAVPLSQYFFFL